MLKICLVGQRFRILSRSNDSGLLWQIARGLAKQGYKVTVISTRSPIGKSEVIRDGVTAYYLFDGNSPYTGMSFREAAYQKFLELHKQEKFDLVHSLDDSGYKIGKHRKDLQIAVAYDVEATQISQLLAISGMTEDTASSMIRNYVALVYKFISTFFTKDRKLLQTADGVFVTHHSQRLILERFYLYPDFHIYTLPYGAEVSDLRPREESLETRKQLGLPEHAKVIVTVSDLLDVNEVLPLINAFEKVAIKKSNARMVIVGSGPQYKKIEYEVLRRALGSMILMPGATSNRTISDYVSAADLFVSLSSQTSGFEYGLLDAMAQKKTIVGSEVSPLSNFIEDGVDGYLIRPADFESLAEIMMSVLSDDQVLTEIGEKARQKVIEMFDPAKMIQSAVKSYSQILKNRDFNNRRHDNRSLEKVQGSQDPLV